VRLAGSWEPYRPWTPQVLHAVKDLRTTASFAPDAIVTFGHPWIDHEIGLELKRMLQLPLIAHFSDPWVDNPLVGLRTEAARTALRGREAAVVHGADHLIFTSAETLDLVMSHYPEHLHARASVLPHSFDESLFPPEPVTETGVIRCLGKWYGDRQPDVLLEALRLIHNEKPDFLSGFRFEIIGNYDGDTAAAALPPGVSFRPPVPYLESIRLMATAEALFLIDAPAEQSVFLPSKLIEYIGSKRPVFGITPPGTADRLIRRWGGMTADPRDPEGVARMLYDFLPSLEAWSVDETVRSEFEDKAVAKRFDQLVQDCVASNV
jgi:glycosyltransferase involved in cell wall biosynthesis